MSNAVVVLYGQVKGMPVVGGVKDFESATSAACRPSGLRLRDVCSTIPRIVDTNETPESGGEPPMLRWAFGRDDARIDMYRSIDATSTQIDVVVAGHAQTFRFPDRRSVVAFQAGFEHALLQTGWRLLAFEPERRSGADRRVRQRGIERRGFPALVWSR